MILLILIISEIIILLRIPLIIVVGISIIYQICSLEVWNYLMDNFQCYSKQ